MRMRNRERSVSADWRSESKESATKKYCKRRYEYKIQKSFLDKSDDEELMHEKVGYTYSEEFDYES